MYQDSQSYTYVPDNLAYQPITCYIPPKETMTTHKPTLAARLVKKGALLMGAIGAALIIGSYLPSAVFSASDGVQSRVASIISNTTNDLDVEAVRAAQARGLTSSYQPQIDTSLPLESRLTISSIGVNTLIHEAEVEDYEEALRKGVWRTPNYGTPYKRNLPMILAAHRFGYLKWDNEYRRQNSFYNLPKLKAGDTVEITWNQRKYVYAVYDVRQGDKIEDYSADLILYTCRDLTSSVRHFVYAKLLEV